MAGNDKGAGETVFLLGILGYGKRGAEGVEAGRTQCSARRCGSHYREMRIGVRDITNKARDSHSPHRLIALDLPLHLCPATLPTRSRYRKLSLQRTVHS